MSRSDGVDANPGATVSRDVNDDILTQLTVAVAELRALWRALGAEVRAANRRAQDVSPMHGFRPRSAGGRAAARQFRNLLTADEQGIVDEAVKLRTLRQQVRDVADSLEAGSRIDKYTMVHGIDLEALAARNACPTFLRLTTEWRATLTEAGVATPVRPLDGRTADLMRRIDRLQQKVQKARRGLNER
jgi:hypothetical protein